MKKVLMISTDRQILDGVSPVALRMREYAEIFGELHIIVFSTEHAERVELSPKCFVYPTGSSTRYAYIFDAVRIGTHIMSLDEWVITTQDPFETGIVGLFLARKYKTTLNVQIHTDFLSPYFVRGSRLNRVRRIVARCVIPRATSIRVVSERIRLSLTQGNGYAVSDSKITVLPLYSEVISATSVSRRFPQFEKVILMVSRLEPEKDIGTAFKAFSVVAKSLERVGLVVVGSGGREVELVNLATFLGLSNKIVFVGWKDKNDLAQIRASADIFLSTSLYEGYGLTLLEAAQDGLALVSTDVGIAPELLPKERLAEPGDVAGITQLLIDALSHPEGFRVQREVLGKVTYGSKEDFLARLKASLLI